MDFISELLTFKDGVKANLFATSRHIDRIQRKFSRCISLEIKATDEDIRMYLKGQRRRFSQDMVSDELQARIESKVIKASENMYVTLRDSAWLNDNLLSGLQVFASGLPHE